MKKNKNLVVKQTSSVLDDLPLAVIADRLKTIFRKHISRKKSVDMPTIYEHVYGNKECTKFQYIFRCQRIMSVMTWLKKKTNYFIVGENTEDGYVWYIVKTDDEAKSYKAQVNKKILGLEHMKRLCQKAVNTKCYKRLY